MFWSQSCAHKTLEVHRTCGAYDGGVCLIRAASRTSGWSLMHQPCAWAWQARLWGTHGCHVLGQGGSVIPMPMMEQFHDASVGAWGSTSYRHKCFTTHPKSADGPRTGCSGGYSLSCIPHWCTLIPQHVLTSHFIEVSLFLQHTDLHSGAALSAGTAIVWVPQLWMFLGWATGSSGMFFRSHRHCLLNSFRDLVSASIKIR